MRASPTVTIGLPTYNRAKYLGQTLESILGQTFQDFEIILCDDHSSDDTFEIARAFAATDDRVLLYRHEHNRGFYLNFNLPLMWARGDYFILAGQDDVWEPRFLERLVAILENDPSVAVATSVLDLIDERGVPFQPHSSLTELNAADHLSSLSRFILRADDVGGANAFHGLFRTAALRKAEGYVRWGRRAYGEDTLLPFRLMSDGRLVVHSELLWHKRWLPYSLGATIWPPRGRSLPARIRGILVDFRDLYAYVNGYSRILRRFTDLSPSQRIRLQAIVKWRTVQLLARKTGRTVAAGIRRMAGTRRQVVTSGPTTDRGKTI